DPPIPARRRAGPGRDLQRRGRPAPRLQAGHGRGGRAAIPRVRPRPDLEVLRRRGGRGRRIRRLQPEWPHQLSLVPPRCARGPARLVEFVWENDRIEPSCLLALKEGPGARTRGIAVAIANREYADPTKLDAAMPCFRLGALGTESERHKRVNGLYSCLFEAEH